MPSTPKILSSPKLQGVGSGVMSGGGAVIALDVGVQVANDLTGNAVGNFLDNTIGPNFDGTGRNLRRLLGDDWKWHWSMVFHHQLSGDKYEIGHNVVKDKDGNVIDLEEQYNNR